MIPVLVSCLFVCIINLLYLVFVTTEALYRSDFFPGLGWMLTKDLWNELEVKWPKA